MIGQKNGSPGTGNRESYHETKVTKKEAVDNTPDFRLVMEDDYTGMFGPEWVEEQLGKYIIKPGPLPPMPEVVVYFNGGLLTRQALSGITGKEKGGKSALRDLIGGAVISGQKTGPIRPGPGVFRVLVDDTEQGPYWGTVSANRIKELGGGKGMDNLTYLDCRVHNAEERLALLDALIVRVRPDLVIIDGIADLCASINDESEAVALVGRLMKWSVIYNCHIMCIIHQNRSSQNANGWMGAVLSKKVELLLEVNKSKESDKISVVTPLLSRGKPPEPCGIRWDAEGLPYIVDGTFLTSSASDRKAQAAAPEVVEKEVHLKVLRQVVPDGGITRQKLIAGLQEALHWEGFGRIGLNKLREWVEYYLGAGYIRQDMGVKYHPFFLVYQDGLPIPVGHPD